LESEKQKAKLVLEDSKKKYDEKYKDVREDKVKIF
jgi:peptidylprolyl isomerase